VTSGGGEETTNVLDRFRLDGKVAVVTGASSGLGVLFSTALADAGADLVLGARRAELLEETRRAVEARGRRCICVRTDVVSPDDCEALVAAATEQLGGPHILVNNAGVGSVVPAHKEDPAEFLRVLHVHLLGAYQMAQSFARACIAAGHPGAIVNVSSVLGLVSADVPQAAYVSAKAGLLGLTRELAMQWTARRGIRVNALVPGLMDAGITGRLTSNEEHYAAALTSIPMGRLGDPSELAGALLLLVSDAGSYITGSSLVVDGGWTIH
jgi:NAD(P)-dependent dehydrogenase (short-subunit alcohol dehydrogenase family)